MLTTKLIHPTILEVLAGSGHGGKILIADGNYPFTTRANPDARRVYLNLMPGKLTVTEVLEALLTVIPVEAADVMITDSGEEPEIYADFRKLLPGLALQAQNRYAFYDKCFDRDVCLVIATGEQRLYANILLTVGVVHPA
jgi:L-fucose mutarotase